ncbi:hypothetical protein AVS7_03358 [Acidovorax sp. MR-S7]|nr:hypothetical protein AVS7_03358 [Acidovorax sp. MR-S7]
MRLAQPRADCGVGRNTHPLRQCGRSLGNLSLHQDQLHALGMQRLRKAPANLAQANQRYFHELPHLWVHHKYNI